MNIHRSKKIGFISTIVVHLAIFILCIFSSITYNETDSPAEMEIEILVYSDVNDEINKIEKDLSAEMNSNNKMEQEKMILDNSEDVTMQNVIDTIKSQITETNIEESISDKLEDLFIQINANNDIPKVSSSDLNTDEDISAESREVITNSTIDNYQLSDNRLAIIKTKPNYTCNQTGTIIVRVWVNREGQTVKVEAGIRGTTDSSSCLVQEAESAALSTTWTPFLDAPEIQIGQITYNFYQN